MAWRLWGMEGENIIAGGLSRVPPIIKKSITGGNHMFSDISLVAVPDTDKLGAVLKADATHIGQAGYLDGVDTTSGDPNVTPVSDATGAGKARKLLGMIYKEPISNEDVSSPVLTTGTRVIFVKSANSEIEHANLSGIGSSGDFDNANPGDALTVNASGNVTTSGAADEQSGTPTTFAYFVSVKGTAVTYRLA